MHVCGDDSYASFLLLPLLHLLRLPGDYFAYLNVFIYSVNCNLIIIINNSMQDVAAACLFMSGKSEECPRKIDHIVRAWWNEKFPGIKIDQEVRCYLNYLV